jgi:Family of unknown function (DUF6491)
MTVPRRSIRVASAVTLLFVAALLGLTAPAAAANKSNNTCFYRRDVESFSAPDDHTVYVRVGANRIYRLDLMTRCLDLTFRQRIGLERQPATPWICSPLEATVTYDATGISQRCPVRAIHKLTPDEVTALPKRDRP